MLQMAKSYNNIGVYYGGEGEDDKAIEYQICSLKISEELGDNHGLGYSLLSIGSAYYYKGDFERALEYYDKSLKIREEIADKRGILISLDNIGAVYWSKNEYIAAKEYLNKSISLQKENGHTGLKTITYFYLIDRHLGSQYDISELYKLIKETNNIEFDLNLRLYQLLEDTTYLKTAYTQIQEKVNKMEKELGQKFLSYPIPKAIVEEWEKVK